MTILNLFNETLKRVPSISKGIEEFITKYAHTSMNEWPEEKKQQAVRILRQLQQEELLTCEHCLDHEYVALIGLSITLTPKECGIDADTFGPENILHADKYVKGLLADINDCSSEIKFSFKGHNSDKGEFHIGWEF